MSEQQADTCLGCGGELQPIAVMDLGNQASFGTLQYRSVDDKRNFWTGKYPTAGPVQAFMCQDCGRIAMFGQVAAEPTE